jgi:hypothetical protein
MAVAKSPERPGALDDHLLMGFEAADAFEGVDDRTQRTAGGRGHPVSHTVGYPHAARGREYIAVLREAADQIREALAVGAHVLFLPPAQGRRVLHAALVALAAVHVRPQQAVALGEWLADGVLTRPGAEGDHRAHHLVAEDDG